MILTMCAAEIGASTYIDYHRLITAFMQVVIIQRRNILAKFLPQLKSHDLTMFCYMHDKNHDEIAQ